MQDIANKAGVSKGTVSYVLNGKQEKARINRETCARVIAIAESLGYRRNAIAQSMKTGKTNVIGFIGGLGGEYVMGIIRGINDCIQDNGYLIKLMGLKHKEDFKKIARQCVEQRLSGVICRALSEDELEILHQELQPHSIPIVLVDNSFSHNWCPRVISDDKMGISLAVKHLTGLGHTRIGHLTAKDNSGFIELRKEGFESSMSEHGLGVSEANICRIENLLETTPEMHKAFDKFFREFEPTAIVCASDPLAMKLIQWAYKRNIKIPDKLSLTGFANLDYTLSSAPALTTIEQPFEKLGKRAAEKLMEVIKGKTEQRDELLPVKLIVRESTLKLMLIH